jgi:hypothetical protein
MKHGRKPTRVQRARLRQLGLNPEAWLITKDCPECFEIEHRVTGKVRKLGA